mgnify:FL=1
MAGAVLAHADTAVGSADLDIIVRIAQGVADLLKGAAGGEHGERAGKGHQAHGGKAGGHVYHVALRDAAVKMPLRERLLKHAGFGCGGQVGIQHHDVVILLT